MVEIRTAGPRLADQRDRVLERHARRLTTVARGAGRALPEALAIGLTGGADELATREIRAGRIDGLSGLVDPIVTLTLAALSPGTGA